MDSLNSINESAKFIEGVYKNLLENFNPCTRQLINSSKAYLKALHGSSAASSLYLDSLQRISKQAKLANNNTTGDDDIGPCLVQITETFKDIHLVQLATLKSFYVDFILPLETNLDKDTRVLQLELKKFQSDLKHRQESYMKAITTVKKIKKKGQQSHHIDREIRGLQNMEEQRSKIDSFIDQATREATLSNRRRYGFILERQSSLAKHYNSLYIKGTNLITPNIDKWINVSKDREVFPVNKNTNNTECIYCSVGTLHYKKEAKAIYNFNSNKIEANNQLSFEEGDTIKVLGPINKGWQYGENTRTNQTGWFPIAYIANDSDQEPQQITPQPIQPTTSSSSSRPHHNQKLPPPPPNLSSSMIQKKSHPVNDFSSSNDSGISDQLIKQPEIDYSDDDIELIEEHDDEYHNSRTRHSSNHMRRTPSNANSHSHIHHHSIKMTPTATATNSIRATPIRSSISNYTNTWLSRTQSFNSLNSENKIKKMLNRTKSLLFKKEPEPDSISIYDSNLWASHDSIIPIKNEELIVNDQHQHFQTIQSESDEDNSVFSTEVDEIPITALPPPPPPMPDTLIDQITQENTRNLTINQTIILNNNSNEEYRHNSVKYLPKYVKSERTGNLNGPWYDLWGEDQSIQKFQQPY